MSDNDFSFGDEPEPTKADHIEKLAACNAAAAALAAQAQGLELTIEQTAALNRALDYRGNTATNNPVTRIATKHYRTVGWNGDDVAHVCAEDGDPWPCDVDLLMRGYVQVGEQRGRYLEAYRRELEVTRALGNNAMRFAAAVQDGMRSHGLTDAEVGAIVAVARRDATADDTSNDVVVIESANGETASARMTPEINEKLLKLADSDGCLTGEAARKLLADMGLDTSKIPADADLRVSVVDDCSFTAHQENKENNA